VCHTSVALHRWCGTLAYVTIHYWRNTSVALHRCCGTLVTKPYVICKTPLLYYLIDVYIVLAITAYCKCCYYCHSSVWAPCV